jgi:hypothetical protein
MSKLRFVYAKDFKKIHSEWIFFIQLSGLQAVQNPDDYPLILGASLAGGMNPFGPGGVGAVDGGAAAGGGHILHQHVSVRDSFVGSAGPIRTKSRIDTSPYGADRYSQGGYHLSPPDPSWRRVHSDSSIHQSVGGAGAGGGVPVANQNGNLSPLHGNSPRLGRRGNRNASLPRMSAVDVSLQFTSGIRYKL